MKRQILDADIRCSTLAKCTTPVLAISSEKLLSTLGLLLTTSFYLNHHAAVSGPPAFRGPVLHISGGDKYFVWKCPS